VWVHGLIVKVFGSRAQAGLRAGKVSDEVRKMTTIWLRVASPLVALFGVTALTCAPALANCDWYVKTALEQQQRNLKLKCGFTGAEWSVDKGAHATWCASVGPDVSRASAQKREAALGQCGAH
jgi:hypothetical protein